MWIQELNIKNFGKFTDKKITLGPHINLIYGDNESGKTTLHAFIRGCFYGVRKMRGRASKTDVFSRYQPWENPAYYAGAVRFVCGDKVFRLERDFTKGIHSGVLVCETDGEKLSLENGDLEMLLGNVGEMAFDNTVSIGQLKSETDEGLAIELKNYMANVEGTGDASIRVEKALVLLKEKRKQLEKQLLEEKKKDEDKIRRIETRIQFLKEEEEKERRELSKMKGLLLEVPKKKDPPGLIRRILLWFKQLLHRLFGRKSMADSDTAFEKDKILGKVEHLESQIQEKDIQIKNCYQEIEIQKEKAFTRSKEQLQKEIEACNLAMNRIGDVVSQMQLNVGQFLKKRTSEIFSEITEGRYPFVEVSEDLKLGIHGADRFVSVEQLSRGTIWQLYFALRMAVNEVLCQEEDLPVILDDAFVMYDEGRLGQTLEWLSRQKKQVIIFTCQKREKQWLLRSGTPFHEINLTR